MEITTLIAWLGAITGTTSLFWDIYKWNQDKRPVLRVEPKLTLREIKLTRDDFGGAWHRDDFCMVLTLRNPTDKDIQVEDVSYVDEAGKNTKVIPWRPLPLVSSQKTAEIIIQLENLVRPMSGTKSIGHFVITDVLGNISKSGETFHDLSDSKSFFPSEREYIEWIMTYQRELPAKELTQLVDNSEPKS